MATWIIVYTLAALVVIILSFKNIKNLFFGYVFILPFFGLMVDLGINLTIDRVLALIMGLVLLFNFRKINHKTVPIFVTIFIVYAIILTLIMSLFIPMSIYDPSIFRGQWRSIFQLLMFLLNIVPLIFALTYLDKADDIKKAAKVFLSSISILAVLGLLQFAVWYINGKNIIPLNILRPSINQITVLLTVDGSNFLRVSSLGGEAKHFALSLVFGLNIIFVKMFYHKKSWSDLFLAMLLFLVLILTFSTQGYVLLTAGIITFIVGLLFLEGLGKTRKIFLLLIPFVLFSVLLFYYYPNLWQSILNRSSERVWQPYVGISNVDEFNTAVLGFLAYSPVYWVIGVGWGNMQYYARDFLTTWTQTWTSPDLVFGAQSGILRIVSELGIPGLLLFLIMYLKPVFYLWKVKFKTILEKELIIYTMFALVAFSLTQDGPTYIYAVLAMVYLLYNFRRYPKKTNDKA